MSHLRHCQKLPLASATALHAMFYSSADWLAHEQQQVFGRSWQLVGHCADLVGVGDHIIAEVADKPVLVVRQADNTLKAFYNVCRHRAGPIATCNGRAAKALHCAYHGWTYTLTGQLRAAPEMQAACDFQVEDIRLPEIAVREWQGLVFVALAAETPPFDELMAGIVERIKPIDISALRFHNRTSYDIDCNWKVYIDNFLEGYHLPHVHPGLSKVLDYRAYDTELFPWYSLQHSPLRNNDGIYGDGNAWYYFLYPNIMLNITPGRMQTNRILPLGPQRCRIEFDYYYSAEPDVLARIAAEQAFSDEIQQEDIDICLAVQKGLRSGSYEAGRLCPKREAGVWHFQNLLRDAYQRVLAVDA